MTQGASDFASTEDLGFGNDACSMQSATASAEGRFQPDMKTKHGSSRHIDCERQPRSANGAAMFRVHNHHVRERVIHLDQLECFGRLPASAGVDSATDSADLAPNCRRATNRASSARMRLITVSREGRDPVLLPTLTDDFSIDLLHGFAGGGPNRTGRWRRQ